MFFTTKFMQIVKKSIALIVHTNFNYEIHVFIITNEHLVQRYHTYLDAKCTEIDS